MHSATGRLGTPPAGLRLVVVKRVINFVFSSLTSWRDEEPEIASAAEEDITHNLFNYLESEAHGQEEFFFHLEDRQAGTRRIDLSVKPAKTLQAKLFINRNQSITVFEAKRLPTPTKKREKEYVSGGRSMTGGIQRFKACEHGAAHEEAAMIGYIQKYDAPYFHQCINSWIKEIALDSTDGLSWADSDCLQDFEHNPNDKTSRAISYHQRVKGQPICLHHLWIEMAATS